MDSILTAAAKKMRDAIATKRDAAGFELTAFEIDYDYDGRDAEGGLEEGTQYVTVVVPQDYISTGRVTRTEFGYVAAFHIDIREKLGLGQQEGSSGLAEKQQIDRVIRLGEQLHAMWEALEQEGTWLTLADHGLVGEWIDPERSVEGVTPRNRSAHVIAYSEPQLSEDRLILGVCREVFLFTEGT